MTFTCELSDPQTGAGRTLCYAEANYVTATGRLACPDHAGPDDSPACLDCGLAYESAPDPTACRYGLHALDNYPFN
jgi:hypothetical protein